jgi:hypothetical protein
MKRFVMVAAAGAIAAFGVFVALAQAQAIFVSYFTLTHIEFEGLEDQYPVNGSMVYTISLKGYGSNCIAFEAEMLREDPSILGGEEKVAYFKQIQDCRKINISHGPYNYSKDFSYGGNAVLGKPGDYRVEVTVLDQITGQKYVDTHSFGVKEEPKYSS